MGVRAAFSFDMKHCYFHMDSNETCLLIRSSRPVSLVLESLGASRWSVVEHSGSVWCGWHHCSLLFHPPHPTDIWLGHVANTMWLWDCVPGRGCKSHGSVLTMFFFLSVMETAVYKMDHFFVFVFSLS